MSYKVCYVTTLPITLENFVLKSALYNIDRGNWEITFVSSESDDFESRIPSNIKYVPITIKRGIHLSGVFSVVSLLKLFRKNKYDLVQYATSNAGCYASIAAKLAGIKNRLYCQWGLGYVQLKGIRRLVFESVERVICRLSTAVRPDSFSNLEIGINEGLYDRSKACVIGYGSSCGVDITRFDIQKKNGWKEEICSKYHINYEKNNKNFVFGYVGRLLGDKGINELIIAAQKLIQERNNVRFLIVGDPSPDRMIDRELFKYALEDEHFIFTDFKRDVEKYYAAIDCLVLPSYHEGFPTSLLECQAMGTPCIVTNIPGCKDAILPDITGILVKPQNVESLYQGMCYMLENMTLCSKMGNNGRFHVVSKYQQEYVFKKIFEDRDRILKGIC